MFEKWKQEIPAILSLLVKTTLLGWFKFGWVNFGWVKLSQVKLG